MIFNNFASPTPRSGRVPRHNYEYSDFCHTPAPGPWNHVRFESSNFNVWSLRALSSNRL